MQKQESGPARRSQSMSSAVQTPGSPLLSQRAEAGVGLGAGQPVHEQRGVARDTRAERAEDEAHGRL